MKLVGDLAPEYADLMLLGIEISVCEFNTACTPDSLTTKSV